MTFEEWAKSIFKFGTDPEYGIAKTAWEAATLTEREACKATCEAQKSGDPTVTQRKADERQRRREAGQSLVQEWVHHDDVKRLRKYAARLRKARGCGGMLVVVGHNGGGKPQPAADKTL